MSAPAKQKKRPPASSARASNPKERATSRESGREEIRAHLILKPSTATRTDSSPRSIFISAADRTPAEIDQVSQSLKKLGFKVVGGTPAAVTVEGSARLFEKVFGSQVKGRRVMPTRSPLKHSPVGRAWKFASDPKIPLPLQPAIQQIAFPSAVMTHG